MFKSKTNKLYQWSDFSSTSILNKSDLLSTYSLKELNDIYTENKLGNYEFMYKDILLKQIELYDKSDNVNSFIYKGNKYWLDKQQRSCMKTVAESGMDNIEIVMGDQIISITADFLKQFILALEAYAYQCYVSTAKHVAQVKSLQDIEDIINYDYTTGYPDKITLE